MRLGGTGERNVTCNLEKRNEKKGQKENDSATESTQGNLRGAGAFGGGFLTLKEKGE